MKKEVLNGERLYKGSEKTCTVRGALGLKNIKTLDTAVLTTQWFSLYA